MIVHFDLHRAGDDQMNLIKILPRTPIELLQRPALEKEIGIREEVQRPCHSDLRFGYRDLYRIDFPVAQERPRALVRW